MVQGGSMSLSGQGHCPNSKGGRDATGQASGALQGGLVPEQGVLREGAEGSPQSGQVRREGRSWQGKQNRGQHWWNCA